jgi:hypothetical protein
MATDIAAYHSQPSERNIALSEWIKRQRAIKQRRVYTWHDIRPKTELWV